MAATPHADPLVESLVEQQRSMRVAERDIFGALDPAVRDRPMRPGDWSPKDHQAHLTAWKARQANRIRATRLGETFASDDRETDEINAELQAARADWAWPEIVREADETAERLEAEIREAGSMLLVESGRLIGQIYGNGPSHALTHFAWLAAERIGVDEARVAAFVDEHERQLLATPLPDADRGVGLYNLACAHSVAGRLDRARPLLRTAFQLRPDLADFALEDPDLAPLREELPALR